MPVRSTPRKSRRPAPRPGTRVRLWLPTRGWLRYVLVTGLALGVVGLGVIVYLWASYGKRIDASLAGAALSGTICS